MHIITKYVADDGTEYHNQEEAEKHDQLNRECNSIMSKLGKPVTSCKGFIQHPIDRVVETRASLLQLAMPYCDNHHYLDQTLEGGMDIDPSWAHRIIDECCPRPLQWAWFRIMCIDKHGREYNQPYFTHHPDEAPTCLETR